LPAGGRQAKFAKGRPPKTFLADANFGSEEALHVGDLHNPGLLDRSKAGCGATQTVCLRELCRLRRQCEAGGWIAVDRVLLSRFALYWAKVLGGPYRELFATIFFSSGDGIELGTGAQFVHRNIGADVDRAGV